jgi:hypothetical protein
VIPQTVAALLAFLLFVLPGLVFELRRERRWPQRGDTPFREVSRVVLASSSFSALALLILIGVRIWSPALMPDPEAWLREPKRYVPAHYPMVVAFAFTQGALSTGLAALAERLTARGREPTIRAVSAWFRVLRMVVPTGKAPFVHVVLDSGVEYYGWVEGYTSDLSVDDRELELGGRLLRRLPEENQPAPLPQHWERLVISSSAIKTMAVSYLPERQPEPRKEKSKVRRLRRRLPAKSS